MVLVDDHGDDAAFDKSIIEILLEDGAESHVVRPTADHLMLVLVGGKPTEKPAGECQAGDLMLRKGDSGKF